MNDESRTADNRAALDETFARDKERLYALCLRLTGRHHEAEDAVQDTWLTARRAIEGFRGEAALSTWLYRIAIRCATRVRGRREAPGLDFDAAGAETHDPEAREQLRRLLGALDTLSAEHRAVLGLSAIDGLRAAEIGVILGIPEGTVWSRLSAARTTLRAALTR